MRSVAPFLALAASATALAVATAAPCAAQAPGVIRGVGVEAGVLAPGGARRTAAFGGTLDLGLGRAQLRIALSSWIADVSRDSALHGRELALLWLLRSAPQGSADWRFFAGIGPAVSSIRPGSASAPAPARAAAAAQAGVELPLAPPDALGLELRLGGLLPAGGRRQLSLRLGLRVRPGAISRLAAGEPPPPLAHPDAQPAAPPPVLDEVLAGAPGVLAPARVGGALRLEEAAFDSGGIALTRDAYRRLADAGGTLRRLGADPLRVVIYTPEPEVVGPNAASRRAVAVAQALARGGYPATRIVLEVTPADSGEAGAGRILAGTRCVSGCVVPATRLPR